MAKSNSGLPFHHITGLRAVGIVSGRPVWPVMGGDDSEDAAAQAQAAVDAAAAQQHADVSIEDIKAELAALGLTPGQLKGRLAASRKWEDRAKEKDPEFETAKAKAAQYDALLATTQTDQQRAVEQAKQEAKQVAQREAAPRVVKAEFKAAAKGILTDAQLAALLEDRDLTKYITADGNPDEAKIAKIVTDAAPAVSQQQHVTLGQGRKAADVKPSVSSGRELFEANRKKRSA